MSYESYEEYVNVYTKALDELNKTLRTQFCVEGDYVYPYKGAAYGYSLRIFYDELQKDKNCEV